MMMMVMIKMVNYIAEDDDEDLLAPAGQVHLHPDTLLLPPATQKQVRMIIIKIFKTSVKIFKEIIVKISLKRSL